jgi:hypothetical protein
VQVLLVQLTGGLRMQLTLCWCSPDAGAQVYMEHGSILESGVPCQGPSVNPSMLDELCTWRVSWQRQRQRLPHNTVLADG